MIEVAVLKREDWSGWLDPEQAERRAGAKGPYGQGRADHAALTFTWSDRVAQLRHRSTLVHKVLWRLDRLPFLGGAATLMASRNAVSSSDLVLTFFENEAGLASALRRLRVPPFRRRPLVVTVCWLAEESRTMGRATRALWSWLLRGPDALVVLSGNQADVLEAEFGVDRRRITTMPLGIDVDFFESVDRRHVRDIDVLAVGRDRSRDFQTLVHALHEQPWNTVIVTSENHRRAILSANAALGGNVTIVTDIDHVRYADLLSRARTVVTTTVAPAYPSGQTVLLEAMAAGAINVVTDSPAMREYGSHGQTLYFVPPHDPEALTAMITEVLAQDPEQVRSAAREAAREAFSHSRMWEHFLVVIRRALTASQEQERL